MRFLLLTIILTTLLVAPAPARELPAVGRVLVATGNIADERFAQSVILLLKHDATGTVGIMLNRRMEVDFSHLIPDGPSHVSADLFLGGPVEKQRIITLLRTPGEPEGGSRVFDSIYLLGLRQTLDRLKNRDDSASMRLYFGYAGWAPGQLDRELLRGDWHIATPTPDQVFSRDPQRLWFEFSQSPDGVWTLTSPTGTPAS